jgi:hypothetical protein
VDVTAALAAVGDWEAAAAGRLALCAGEWRARVVVAHDDVVVEGFGAAIRGDAHALWVEPNVVGAVVRGLTLSGHGERGGAVRVSRGAELLVEDVAIAGCTATAGAGLASDEGSSVTLRRVTVADGRANRGGLLDLDGQTTLEDVTLSGGVAVELGGAIDVQGSGVVEGLRVALVGNTAAGGGAVRLGSLATLRCTGCTFADNAAAQGGALAVEGGTLTLVDAEVADNEAWEDVGGGLYVSDGGLAEVTGGSWSGNEAAVAGGAAAVSGSTLWMDGVEIVGGAAGASAGAVYVKRGDARLERCAVIAATAPSGGAFEVGGGTLALLGTTVEDASAEVGGVVAALGGADVTVDGGAWWRNVAGAGGGAWVEGGVVRFRDADLGLGVDDNLPEDVWAGGAGWSVPVPGERDCDDAGCQ